MGTPVIPVALEVEARGLCVQSQPQQIKEALSNSARPSLTKNIFKRAGYVAQSLNAPELNP